MSNISEKITDFLVRKKAIKTSDYAIYKYGADILVENVSVTLLLMCFGLFINKCVETIVFILTFVGLRRVSGGYHAPTKTMCHILTFGNWAVLMLLIMIQERYGFAKCWMAMVLCAASLEIVYLYAPVENKRKKLLQEIRIRNRKKTLVLSVGLVAFLLGLWAKLPQASFAMLVTLIEVVLLILIAKEGEKL